MGTESQFHGMKAPGAGGSEGSPNAAGPHAEQWSGVLLLWRVLYPNGDLSGKEDIGSHAAVCVSPITRQREGSQTQEPPRGLSPRTQKADSCPRGRGGAQGGTAAWAQGLLGAAANVLDQGPRWHDAGSSVTGMSPQFGGCDFCTFFFSRNVLVLMARVSVT
ncbi:hypothetical protein VULLAG_LOCUS22104 [Vulpes lagopus]